MKDDTGLPLVGATLFLKDLARGSEVDFKTNKKGFFYRRGIRPSEYELIIEKEGYQPFRDRLRFRAGEEKRLDFLLGAATSPAEEAFQRGLTAFNEGDYEKAAEAFEKAFPNHDMLLQMVIRYLLETIREKRPPQEGTAY